MNIENLKKGDQVAQKNKQEKIWQHFQTTNPEVFEQAQPRMDFLIKKLSLKKNRSACSVLNIGIGDGYFEKSLQKKGWDIHTLDPNEAVIKKMTALGIKGHQGYIEKIPFENETFDFIVASEVVEHLTDEQRHQGLAEIKRVLKKNGMFLGTVPYSEDLKASQVICPSCSELFHRWGHQKSFDLKSLSKDLSKHMKVLEIRKTAFVSFSGRTFSGKIKMLLKLILAKCGETIAAPSIYFCVKKTE